MEQEAHLEIGGPQVVEQLSIGSFVQLVCGLDLDDELAVDDHVHSLVRELVALVHDTNAHLSPYLMTTVRELRHQIIAGSTPTFRGTIRLIRSIRSIRIPFVVDASPVPISDDQPQLPQVQFQDGRRLHSR
jgi:hypothetical protein